MKQIQDVVVNGVRLHVQDDTIYRRVWRGPVPSGLLWPFDYPMTRLKNGRVVWGRPIRVGELSCYCSECRQSKGAIKPERSPYMTDVDIPAAVAARLRGTL